MGCTLCLRNVLCHKFHAPSVRFVQWEQSSPEGMNIEWGGETCGEEGMQLNFFKSILTAGYRCLYLVYGKLWFSFASSNVCHQKIICDIMPGRYSEVNFVQLLDSPFTALWTKGEHSLRLTGTT